MIGPFTIAAPFASGKNQGIDIMRVLVLLPTLTHHRRGSDSCPLRSGDSRLNVFFSGAFVEVFFLHVPLTDTIVLIFVSKSVILLGRKYLVIFLSRILRKPTTS